MRFWFVTTTTYGTRLPGDDRGFVSAVRQPHGPRIRNNRVGTEYDRGGDGLRRAAEEAMRFDAVFLDPPHAAPIIDQFLETCAYRGWTLHAAAILCNHWHALVEVTAEPDPSFILQSPKSYASRKLNDLFGPRDVWWTDGGSKRKKADDFAIYEAVRYTRDQPSPYAVRMKPDSRYVRRLPLFERTYRRDLEADDLNVFDPYDVLKEAHIARVLAANPIHAEVLAGEQGTSVP